MKQILILIVLLNLWLSASAQTIPQIKFWKDALDGLSLEGVADKMLDQQAPKWPRIASAYVYEQLRSNNNGLGAEALELADALRQKLDISFQPNTPLELKDVEKELSALGSIAKTLDGAGGYSNLVLQDSINRLMIFRLAGWLIQNPNKATEVELLFDKIDVPQVYLDELLPLLINQDRRLAERQQVITKIEREKSIYHALDLVGLSVSDVAGFTEPGRVKTSVLLKEASAPALTYRMATTEALRWVHLRGLIQFFKAGGLFAELNPTDIRPFEARMGEEAKRYKYPLLGIRSLTETHLLALISLHREAEQQRVFLEVALK